MSSYVYGKKRKRLSRKGKAFVALFSVACVIALIFVYYFSIVLPTIVTLSEQTIRSKSTIVISQSVERVLAEGQYTYKDLISVERDANNNITNISTNSVLVNNLIGQVTQNIQNEVDNIALQTINISLGTFTGIPFLYGHGPKIPIKLIPVGTVNTNFKSQFKSAGINYTLHSLYFTVSVSVAMLFPSATQNYTTSLDVQICESVLDGRVPDVYLQGQII